MNILYWYKYGYFLYISVNLPICTKLVVLWDSPNTIGTIPKSSPAVYGCYKPSLNVSSLLGFPHSSVPSGTNIAIENCHIYSGFAHGKWWIFPYKSPFSHGFPMVFEGYFLPPTVAIGSPSDSSGNKASVRRMAPKRLVPRVTRAASPVGWGGYWFTIG